MSTDCVSVPFDAGRAQEAVGCRRSERVVARDGSRRRVPGQGRRARSPVVGESKVGDRARQRAPSPAGILVRRRLAAEQAAGILVERSAGKRVRTLHPDELDLLVGQEVVVDEDVVNVPARCSKEGLDPGEVLAPGAIAVAREDLVRLVVPSAPDLLIRRGTVARTLVESRRREPAPEARANTAMLRKYIDLETLLISKAVQLALRPTPDGRLTISDATNPSKIGPWKPERRSIVSDSIPSR